MRKPGFGIIEHTADVGIVAWGEDLAELFSQVAAGMYSIMVAVDDVRETESRELSVVADTLDHLLTNWLTELLFVTETEDLVFSRFEVRIKGTQLSATAFGERLDPLKHSIGEAVKGVTRHMFEIKRVDDGYEARVLLDV